jgi:hypothetical protein
MSGYRTSLRTIFTCTFLLLGSLGAQAQAILYGAQGAGNATSNLYTINQTTGATTVVGPMGQAFTGMALQTSTGTMYGVTNGSSACSRCLATINLATGAATVVGAGLGLTISEVEFGTNGTLYGWSESSDELASINLTTGVATTIPGSGLSTFGDGMALVGGVMYAMTNADNGTYYNVNTATGTVTAAGTLTGGTGGNAVAAASVRPTDNVTYIVINPSGPTTLATVNLTTGVITQLGATLTGTDAIAFAGAATPSGPVPTLSQWTLIALALLLGAIGMATTTVRRRSA